MAGVVQGTIDQFWGQLRRIREGFNTVAAELKADQAELTRLWSATKSDTNAARRAAHQKLLQPLIHQNSVLRLSYLAPIREKYNAAVQIASDALKRAGYTTPSLSGLGVAPLALAPLTAWTLMTVALAILATVTVATQAQRTNTATVARIVANAANLTPEQQQDLLDAINRTNRSLPPPIGLDFGAIAWGLAAVAAIVIVPKLLPARKAAA